MAQDENKAKPYGKAKPPSGGDTDGTAVLIIILLVGVLFFRFLSVLPDYLSSLGIDPGNLETVYEQEQLRTDTPPGVRVVLLRLSDVWIDPSRGFIAGTKERGSLGFLIEGPLITEGQRYWKIDFITGADGWVIEGDVRTSPPFPTLARLINIFTALSFIISFLLFLGAVYSFIGVSGIAREDALRQREKLKGRKMKALERLRNNRWDQVIDHINSPHEAEWRLAILEADIMLDEVLSAMGYHGIDVGEKLKSIEESDFTHLNEAWEAHKIRNKIAHQGSDFRLTPDEAKRTIDLYQRVFEEFRYI